MSFNTNIWSPWELYHKCALGRVVKVLDQRSMDLRLNFAALFMCKMSLAKLLNLHCLCPSSGDGYLVHDSRLDEHVLTMHLSGGKELAKHARMDIEGLSYTLEFNTGLYQSSVFVAT